MSYLDLSCDLQITHHLSELEEEIRERFNEGLFDEEFYRLRPAFFDFNAPESLLDTKSIIVVAVPRPQAQASFTIEGKKKALILPPTYVAYQRTTNCVGEYLTRVLKEKGYRIAALSGNYWMEGE